MKHGDGAKITDCTQILESVFDGDVATSPPDSADSSVLISTITMASVRGVYDPEARYIMEVAKGGGASDASCGRVSSLVDTQRASTSQSNVRETSSVTNHRIDAIGSETNLTLKRISNRAARTIQCRP